MLQEVFTEKVANELHSSMLDVKTEEDVKIRFAYILRKRVLDYFNIPLEYYEYRIGFGYRIDALYNTTIIEYEHYGYLSNVTNATTSLNQLKRYIITIAGSEDKYSNYKGICTDGKSIGFIWYDNISKVWIINRPELIDEKNILYTIELLL